MAQRWIDDYGKRVIEKVYEIPSGWIWLVTKQTEKEKKKGLTCGLVKIYEAEWGPIEVKDIEGMMKDKNSNPMNRPVEVFSDILPCTLAELFEKTPVSSYFRE